LYLFFYYLYEKAGVRGAGVDRRPKLRPKAEAFFPPASASVAEAFWQKVRQKVLREK